MDTLTYFRTDTERDAVTSLAAASDFLAMTDERPHYWRWFVLAIHSALQGALALALHNGNLVHVQKPGVSRRMLDAFDGKGDFPDPHMDNFLRLYTKAQKAENLRSGATPLPVDEQHERALESLDELRDEFIHFNAKSWSLEVAFVLEVADVALDVLGHIFDGGIILWHHDGASLEFSQALQSLKKDLKARGFKTGEPGLI